MRRRDPTLLYIVLFVGLVLGLAVVQGMKSEKSSLTIGAAAPAVGFAREKKGTLHLSELRGKVVLIDFWARGCEPCERMMPKLERMRHGLAGRPFELVSVNIETAPRDKLRAWLNGRNVSMPFFQDTSGIAQAAYRVQAIPRLVLIDKQGILRKVYEGETPIEHLVRDVTVLL